MHLFTSGPQHRQSLVPWWSGVPMILGTWTPIKSISIASSSSQIMTPRLYFFVPETSCFTYGSIPQATMLQNSHTLADLTSYALTLCRTPLIRIPDHRNLHTAFSHYHNYELPRCRAFGSFSLPALLSRRLLNSTISTFSSSDMYSHRMVSSNALAFRNREH